MIGRLSVWRGLLALTVVSNAEATTRVRMAVQPRFFGDAAVRLGCQ